MSKVTDAVAEHVRGLSGYNRNGEEIPDSRPVALPVGFTRPKSIQETIHSLMRNEEFRRRLDETGVETFEESDDFEVEDSSDDITRGSPYEQDFDPHGDIARHQAMQSGFVEEIPAEKKQKAREIIEREKLRQQELRKSPKAKAKPKKEDKSTADESDDDEDED